MALRSSAGTACTAQYAHSTKWPYDVHESLHDMHEDWSVAGHGAALAS